MARFSSRCRSPMNPLFPHPKSEIADQPWVTVSFVPEDLVWFEWVQHHLDRYPVPAALAGAMMPFGVPLPERLVLFPDRWNPLNFEAYPAALETSRFLVLILSPNAANAPWIEDHLATFRQSPGPSRIVVLVVDGVPFCKDPQPSDWLPSWLRERWRDEQFTPATPDQMVIVDARGSAAALEATRGALLAAVLLSSPQELERMGGLLEPLELLRGNALTASQGPELTTSAKDVNLATAVEGKGLAIDRRTRLHTALAIFHKPKLAGYSAGAGAALTFFGAGWFASRAMLPAAPPAAAPAVIAAAEAPAPTPQPPPPVPATSEAAPAAASSGPPAAIAKAAPPTVEPGATEPALSEAEIARREGLKQTTNLLRLQWKSELAAGDKALQANRAQQAADLYHAALITAERYLALRGDDLIAFAEVARHCRKLGAVQTQVASAEEARATYTRGRQLLLALQTRDALDTAGKQCLREVEHGLQTLPRD